MAAKEYSMEFGIVSELAGWPQELPSVGQLHRMAQALAGTSRH
jgi:hypothetical protein